IKHNFSQYFAAMSEKKIHLAVLAAYSREDVTTKFLDIKTDYGSLGFNAISGSVDTWQGQVNASKEFGRFEAMAGFVINSSQIKYEVSGERGSIEDIIPVQELLNKRLEEIYKTRVNYIGEAAILYNMGDFDVQALLAFGKF